MATGRVKTQLKELADQVLRRPLTPQDITYVDEQRAGQFVATVILPWWPAGERNFTGDEQPRKAAAQSAAAQAALDAWHLEADGGAAAAARGDRQ